MVHLFQLTPPEEHEPRYLCWKCGAELESPQSKDAFCPKCGAVNTYTRRGTKPYKGKHHTMYATKCPECNGSGCGCERCQGKGIAWRTLNS